MTGWIRSATDCLAGSRRARGQTAGGPFLLTVTAPRAAAPQGQHGKGAAPSVRPFSCAEEMVLDSRPGRAYHGVNETPMRVTRLLSPPTRTRQAPSPAGPGFL